MGLARRKLFARSGLSGVKSWYVTCSSSFPLRFLMPFSPSSSTM